MTDSSNDQPAADAPKALITKPSPTSMGALASQQDPAELDAIVTAKREALLALSRDPAFPDAMRKVVETLAALASPHKEGLEEVITAWKVPRINIVQPTTQSEAKPESARQGALYTTSGQLLDLPWGGIVLYMYEENINFPEQGKNPVCQSPDAKLGSPFGKCIECPHLPFGKQNGGRGDQQKTDCQNNIVAVMLTQDLTNPQVYVVQFGKTSRKAGSALMGLVGQQTAVWNQSYLLNTEKKVGDRGVYYIYKIEPTGKNNDEHTRKLARALYELFIAERKRFLADWYARPMRAPMAAAEAEGNFAAGALEAGLAPNAGVEPDFSTAPSTSEAPPAAATADKNKGKGTTSARTSPKPM